MLWIDWFIKIQVCERSLNNTLNGPTIPPGQHFVRADMLPSGYLIRPCEGGGSIIHIVDHVNLEVSNPFSSNSFNYLISHNIWLTEAFFFWISLGVYLKSYAHFMNRLHCLLKKQLWRYDVFLYMHVFCELSILYLLTSILFSHRH